MFLKLMNLLAVLLLMLGLFLRPQGTIRGLLTWSVCAIAMLIAGWMLRKGQRTWAFTFAVVALFFNPIFLLAAGSIPLLAVDSAALVTFMTLAFFQTMPRLTASSIISEEPRRSSL